MLNWYHSKFEQAAKNRYVAPATRAELCELLERYFGGRAPAGRHIDPQPLRYDGMTDEVAFAGIS